MDCEFDHKDRDSNKTVTNVREQCTIALIDTRFVFFNGTFKIPKSGFGLATKVENKFLPINDEYRLFLLQWQQEVFLLGAFTKRFSRHLNVWYAII